jgi:hypothetical protein
MTPNIDHKIDARIAILKLVEGLSDADAERQAINEIVAETKAGRRMATPPTPRLKRAVAASSPQHRHDAAWVVSRLLASLRVLLARDEPTTDVAIPHASPAQTRPLSKPVSRPSDDVAAQRPSSGGGLRRFYSRGMGLAPRATTPDPAHTHSAHTHSAPTHTETTPTDAQPLIYASGAHTAFFFDDEFRNDPRFADPHKLLWQQERERDAFYTQGGVDDRR